MPQRQKRALRKPTRKPVKPRQRRRPKGVDIIRRQFANAVRAPDRFFVCSRALYGIVDLLGGGEIAALLDWFNNNDSVVFMAISPEPCEFDSICWGG